MQQGVCQSLHSSRTPCTQSSGPPQSQNPLHPEPWSPTIPEPPVPRALVPHNPRIPCARPCPRGAAGPVPPTWADTRGEKTIVSNPVDPDGSPQATLCPGLAGPWRDSVSFCITFRCPVYLSTHSTTRASRHTGPNCVRNFPVTCELTLALGSLQPDSRSWLCLPASGTSPQDLVSPPVGRQQPRSLLDLDSAHQ